MKRTAIFRTDLFDADLGEVDNKDWVAISLGRPCAEYLARRLTELGRYAVSEPQVAPIACLSVCRRAQEATSQSIESARPHYATAHSIGRS